MFDVYSREENIDKLTISKMLDDVGMLNTHSEAEFVWNVISKYGPNLNITKF